MSADRISPEAPWAPPRDILNLTSEEEFTTVQGIIQNAIKKAARLHAYSTLDTFVKFHQAYRSQKELSLEQFTVISPVKHEESSLSCIGLCSKVMKYISEGQPTLGPYLFLGVCGEFYPDFPEPKEPPSNEMASLFDHVLVVLAINFKGRKGFIFADFGMLIDIPIVVMADSGWPHTGPFRTVNVHGHRENDVHLVNDEYTFWKQTDYKPNGKAVVRIRYVYLGRPFLQTDKVERRAKVIPFKGHMLLGDGGFKAGLFIILGKDKRRFTCSVPNESGEQTSVQFPYEFFCSDSVCSDDTENHKTRAILETFSNMCGFGGKEGIMKKFRQLSETCKDAEFIEQAIVLDKKYYDKLNETLGRPNVNDQTNTL